MKTLNLFSISFFLLINLYSFSQKKYELGKVTIEELNEKSHPIDSSAVAAILFKKGSSTFYLNSEGRWSIETVVNCKIKVYKKEGLKQADFKVPYFVGGNAEENVFFSEAATYNLVDNKVVRTKLKSEGEFKEKLNKNWNIKKISMPSVKEGSIIEFSYKFVSPYISTFNDWEFQTEIPVNYVEYKAYIPKYFSYNTIITGAIKVDYKTETIDNSAYGEKKHTYIGENVPAIKDESFVNNIKNYTSILKFELGSISYPNKPNEQIAQTWDDVTKTIYESENFGGELKKNSYFEEEAENLVKGLTSRDDKIAAVFNFVKSKIKWNEDYGYSCNDGIKKAYKDLIGNVAEINLILTAMLRHVGVDANPILLSTRSNGISFFPTRTSFNYVIAGVEIENDIILLDATDKNSCPNILPIRDLNWIGRIIRKEGSSAEVDLMPKMISSDVTNIMATISSDGTVEGKVREQHFDYNAFVFRDKYATIAKESYLESLEKKHNNIEINEYDVKGKQELSEPITENYSFKSTNIVEVIGDKLYFSPLLFLATKENPFKQDKREYPVDFIYPNQDRFLINLTIPDGYVVESLPKSVSIPMSNNYINVKYLLSNTDNKIQMLYTNDTNTSIIGADDYDELKQVYNEIVKKENEKIVLKKV